MNFRSINLNRLIFDVVASVKIARCQRCLFTFGMRSFCSMDRMNRSMMDMSTMDMSMNGKVVLCIMMAMSSYMMDTSMRMGWSMPMGLNRRMVNRDHGMHGILECMQVNGGYAILPANFRFDFLF